LINSQKYKVPIYAWGRYYKYELAGDAFDMDDSNGTFCEYSYMIQSKLIDFKLLKKIDEQIEQDEELQKAMDDCDRPSRSNCVKEYGFDERGGRALIIVKTDNGKLKLECVECDSPE
jgi:hypothetical protein